LGSSFIFFEIEKKKKKNPNKRLDWMFPWAITAFAQGNQEYGGVDQVDVDKENVSADVIADDNNKEEEENENEKKINEELSAFESSVLDVLRSVPEQGVGDTLLQVVTTLRREQQKSMESYALRRDKKEEERVSLAVSQAQEECDEQLCRVEQDSEKYMQAQLAEKEHRIRLAYRARLKEVAYEMGERLDEMSGAVRAKHNMRMELMSDVIRRMGELADDYQASGVEGRTQLKIERDALRRDRDEARRESAAASLLVGVQRAVYEGTPFIDELSALQSTQSNAQLAPLAKFARTGVPSRVALLHSFMTSVPDELRTRAEQASADDAARAPPSSDDMSVVTPPNPIVECPRLIVAGQLCKCVSAIEAADDDTASHFGDWLAQANERLQIERAFDTVASHYQRLN
jgi:hypothetical protein